MEEILAFLKELRETIIDRFKTYEKNKSFNRVPWDYQKGWGGGEMGVLRGDVFEKGAVNFSKVEGLQFPGPDGEGPFVATGVSLITHMFNPHAPTVHMNLRYIETKKRFWFGGGYDLTPMGFPYKEDADHFHDIAKQTLDTFGVEIYPKFREQAKQYFYIPHREKERGVGGIFFDHFNTGDFEADFALWKGVGNTFLEAYCPILDRRVNQAFTPEEKEKQCRLRAHYAEFNLVYDRGTKFGIHSGGNIEAIFCSMPPVAKW